MIVWQVISFIFLACVYFKISDEGEKNKTFLNKVKSYSMILAAASVFHFGKNIFVIAAAVGLGMLALVKRKNPL